jgi:hypothetical protein
MSDNPSDRRPETPRHEPEIIPPGRDGRREGPVFIHIDEREGVRRVTFNRPGIFSVVLGLVVLALIAVLVLVLLAGVLIFWIPIIAGVVVLALLYGAIRYRWLLLTDWWSRGR